MVKSYNEVEACIEEALGSISPDKEFSIPELANKFNVPVRQLQNRIKGTGCMDFNKVEFLEALGSI